MVDYIIAGAAKHPRKHDLSSSTSRHTPAMDINQGINTQARITIRDRDQEVTEFLADMDGWSFSHKPTPDTHASYPFPCFTAQTPFASFSAPGPTAIPIPGNASSSTALGFDQNPTFLSTLHIGSAAEIWPHCHEYPPVYQEGTFLAPSPTTAAAVSYSFLTHTTTLNPLLLLSGSQNESSSSSRASTASSGAMNPMTDTMVSDRQNQHRNHDIPMPLPTNRSTNRAEATTTPARAIQVRRPKRCFSFLEPLNASAFKMSSTTTSCQQQHQRQQQYEAVFSRRRGRPPLIRMDVATERSSHRASSWPLPSASSSSSRPSKFFFLETASGPPVKRDGRSYNCVKMLKHCTLLSRES